MDEEKKVKKKLSKKNIFLLVFDIILILIVFCIIFVAINHEKIEYYGLGYYLKYMSYINKGYELYGDDEEFDCGISSSIWFHYDVCQICGGEENIDGYFCVKCCKITNRCPYCGNLYSETIKEKIDKSGILYW